MTPDDAPIAPAAQAREPGRPPLGVPADAMIVVPVRNIVLFPEIVFPITIGRPLSVQAAQAAVREQRQVLILLQKDPGLEAPGPNDFYTVGTVANILRYVTAPDGAHHVICQGVQRFRVTEYVPDQPFIVARGLVLPEPQSSGSDIEARFLLLQQQSLEVISLLPQAPQELRLAIENAQ